MAIKVNQRYRIKRNAKYEEQMRYLTQDLKIFQDYSSLLVVSAIIGFLNDTYVPIEKTATDGVLMQFFSEKHYDLMDLLAYSRVKEQSVLTAEDDRKYTIFEAYANGGFPILVEKLGVDFVDKSKNDHLEILRQYYTLLVSDGFKMVK